MNKKAILLSGGLDSICLAYWFRNDIEVAITIDYGQNAAKAELTASKEVCKQLSIHHEIVTVDCRSLGVGEMIGDYSLPVASSPEWWPYRNQLLITLAAMKLARFKVNELIFGTVRSDAKHIDGTKHFFNSIDELVKMQELGLTISTPGRRYTTRGLIRASNIPEELLLWAHSCHVSNHPCGQCNGCLKYVESVSRQIFNHVDNDSAKEILHKGPALLSRF